MSVNDQGQEWIERERESLTKYMTVGVSWKVYTSHRRAHAENKSIAKL